MRSGTPGGQAGAQRWVREVGLIWQRPRGPVSRRLRGAPCRWSVSVCTGTGFMRRTLMLLLLSRFSRVRLCATP